MFVTAPCSYRAVSMRHRWWFINEQSFGRTTAYDAVISASCLRVFVKSDLIPEHELASWFARELASITRSLRREICNDEIRQFMVSRFTKITEITLVCCRLRHGKQRERLRMNNAERYRAEPPLDVQDSPENYYLVGRPAAFF